MSIDLILEVMDHAPADLTSGERLVLVVIAERANDKTRIAKQSSRWSLDTIAKRAGVKRTGLKSIFQGLARKGCEVRIPVKFTPDGKPVFAFEGTAVTFKVPHLAERGGHSIPTERGGQDIPTQPEEGMPQHPRGEAVASERGGHDHPQSLMPLKEPSNTSSLSARTSVPSPRDPDDDRERDDSTTSEDQTPTPTTAAGKMLAKHGVYGLEADQAESFIRRTVEHPIQGDGWWYAADSNGSLNTWIQRWRDSPAQQPAQPDDTRMCPLHTRFPMFNCNVCWADVIGGDDPYTGREDERPPGWREAYNRQKRSSERGRIAPSIRSEPGSHTEEWARRRAAEAEKATRGHEPYSNPPPEAYADWLTGQPEQSAIEGNRTPRGGQLGRIFASREADYDEKL